ncbi:MAG: DNA repair protein RadC [Myxococcota bacterium]
MSCRTIALPALVPDAARSGPAAPAALLAQVLGRGPEARRLAEALLSRVGGLQGLADVDGATLKAVGVGPRAGARLRAALELGARVAQAPPLRLPPLTSSASAFSTLGPRMRGLREEHFVAIPLDAKARPMGERLVAKGSRTACLVEPADAFRPLVEAGAVSVLFAHNHPSGDPTPSLDDLALTERLRRAGEVLGIEVVDHVVIGASRHFSFRDEGLLGAPSTA